MGGKGARRCDSRMDQPILNQPTVTEPTANRTDRQIGAWVSEQSALAPGGRRQLEAREAELEERFKEGTPVPKPPHWGGFRIVPEAIEFWQGRAGRLHDRIRYTRGGGQEEGSWVVDRLQP
jgi:pyridoxamine 5'-phosphate oxidase